MNVPSSYRGAVRLAKVDGERLSEYERDELISKIFGAKIFYLKRGRNAWHSKWSMVYYSGAFHHDEQSAKRAAEEKRVQGSVFYVSELPALVIDTPHLRFVVTELNTSAPLADYLLSLATQDLPTISPPELLRPLAIGHPVGRALASFRTQSRHWRNNLRKHRDILVMREGYEYLARFGNDTYRVGEQSNSATTCALDSNLRSWTSTSHGSGYFLAWQESDWRMSADPVLGLLADLSDVVA